ncbi:MAG TPA: class I SAM-dependent methyltransferase [Flavisolibacter sp.]|nr:class I SAM-dependent methyltransferase [Flavisolibacter sp.]
MDNTYHYPGGELSLFKDATNWKMYLKKHIQPYLRGEVLEVGAGIGATTRLLNDGVYTSWTMLEPDESMYQNLTGQESQFPENTFILKGTLEVLSSQKFDTIIYIDVLEHIEKDKEELAEAAKLLKECGHLIVLSPAYQFLYSPFDKAIGHYKRYHKTDLKVITPITLKLVQMKYLDSFGFFASVMNKIFLHQTYPTKKQIDFWNKTLIQLSKIADPLFFHSFGKSILAIWEKKHA